jgi:uncharacterized membrane protein
VDLILFIVSVLFDLGPLVLLLAIVAVLGLSRRFSSRREIEALRERVNALEIDLRLLKNAQAAPAATPPAPPRLSLPDPRNAPGSRSGRRGACRTSITPSVEAGGRPRASHPGRSAAAAARADFEEKLGSRWAVWVGGVALALGGLFLVRYSIEQNLLSPATRIALGGLFALALIAAGEWLRRREQGFALPGIRAPTCRACSRRRAPARPSPPPMGPMRSMS